MKNTLWKTFVVFFLVAVIGFSMYSESEGASFIPVVNPKSLTPVTDPNRRYVLQGVSFLPPEGKTWSVSLLTSALEELLPTAGQAVFFIKQFKETPPATPEEFQTIYALVSIVPRFGELSFKPAEYLKYKAREIEKEYREETGTDRFRPGELKMSIDNSLGTDCLKYDKVVEDHGDRRFPGVVFIMSDHFFLCPHPDFPRLIVSLGYSQRYLQGIQPFPVAAELVPFFKSLRFIPIRPLEGRDVEVAATRETARKELNRLFIPFTPGALLVHAQSGNSGVVRLLLMAGLDANATVKGVTALMAAVIGGNSKVVHTLLAKGADVNAKDPKVGATPLMAAASAGSTVIVKALLAAGADVNAKTTNGYTALMFASDKGHTDIIKVLRKAGAKE